MASSHSARCKPTSLPRVDQAFRQVRLHRVDKRANFSVRLLVASLEARFTRSAAAAIALDKSQLSRAARTGGPLIGMTFDIGLVKTSSSTPHVTSTFEAENLLLIT